jgi:hypothetical protein
MGFPFIAPIKKWVLDELTARENNLNNNLLSPFVILSSAAIVTKDKTTAQAVINSIKDGSYKMGTYKGCVVANTTDITKKYQTGNTIVGYDLDGKEIIVEGEKNRRVSVPIITKVDIDTDGGNNTLKTARLDIKIFSLKQLEMFELFFLRPGMNVMLEFGNNADIRNKNIINSKLFATKGFEKYLKDFAGVFGKEENAYAKAKSSYLTTIKETKGCYDYWAGKVTNFTMAPDTDGTYNIMLEISAGNELQLWMPIKQANSKGTTAKQNNSQNESEYQMWLSKMAADLNLPDIKKIFAKESDWKKEFFNWGIINTKQEDTKYSKNSYISFRFILELLNKNIKVFNDAQKIIKPSHFIDSAKTKPIIPVNSCSKLISSNEDVIFPGRLPQIIVSTSKNSKDQIILDPEKTYNCLINDYSFNIDNVKPDATGKIEMITIYPAFEDIDNNKPTTILKSSGNLLNAFVSYNNFVRIYQKAYTMADVINGVLNSINVNLYGMVNFELQKESDHPNNDALTIVDTKLHQEIKPINDSETYRFKIGAQKSIVHNFQFNMELSTLMQAQALYATQIALLTAEKEGKEVTTEEVAKRDPYQHADLSFAANADGYYSVNAIEIQVVKDAQKYNIEHNISGSLTNETPPDKDTDKTKVNMNEVIKGNYVKFKETKEQKNSDVNHMIYKDPSLIQKYIPKQPKNTTALTYLDISIIIDGIVGISCGEYFYIDGVPEIYNLNGYFQVINVKHTIAEQQWKTEIKAGYRLKPPVNKTTN